MQNEIVKPIDKNSTEQRVLNKAQIAELEQAQSLTKIVYNQFKEHKAAVRAV